MRNSLKPFLIENSFEKITDRKYIKTVNIFNYMIEIKSVGNYFSQVTGWPPQSIFSFGGVFCNVIKQWYKWEYHYSVKNLCTLDQAKYKSKLKSEPEKSRNDIWWIDDESNLDEIINNLKESIKICSFDFFNQFANKTVEDIIQETKQTKDGHCRSSEKTSRRREAGEVGRGEAVKLREEHANL
jgi:nicotinic acid mononucleotide adenylyltransferase